MQEPNLFTRDDTFFGVCEGLSEDLGLNANLLRITFALLLFWNPVLTLAGYLAAGCLVFLSRWLFPVPATKPVQEAAESRSEELPQQDEQLPLAA